MLIMCNFNQGCNIGIFDVAATIIQIMINVAYTNHNFSRIVIFKTFIDIENIILDKQSIQSLANIHIHTNKIEDKTLNIDKSKSIEIIRIR